MIGTDLTILVALAAGVISFLSPCVLPLVPAYLGQLSAVAVARGAGVAPGRWLAVRHAVAFVAGFTAVFMLLGATATYLTRGFVDELPALRVIGGAILVVLGLNLAGFLRFPALERTWRPLDAGAAGSLATTTGSVALGTPAGGGGGGDRGPARRSPHRHARWVAGVARARVDLRGRLDAVHRDHPRRHPDDGGDLGDRRAGHGPAPRLLHRPRGAVRRDRARV